MPATPLALQNWVQRHTPSILRDVELAVNTRSGSRDQEGLARCADVMSGIYKNATGIAPERISVCGPDGIRRDFLIWRSGNSIPPKGKSSVIQVGHYDTVDSPDDPPYPFRYDPISQIARGCGVYDDKGQLVVLAYQLKLLNELAPHLLKNVVVYMGADEEISSPSGRRILSDLAQEAVAAIVVEGRVGNGIKTSRPGIGKYFLNYDVAARPSALLVPTVFGHQLLRYNGVAAHSGTEMDRGRDANHAAMTDLRYFVDRFHHPLTGRLVTVHGFDGGDTHNRVSDKCQLSFSVATPSLDELERIRHAMLLRVMHANDGILRNIGMGDIQVSPTDTLLRQSGATAAFRRAAQHAVQLKHMQHPELTINVGRITTTMNATEATIRLALEARAENPNELAFFDATVRAMAAEPGVSLGGDSGIVRPSWPLSPDGREFFEQIVKASDALDFTTELHSTHSRGVTDANTLAALGVPTVDGLSWRGGGDHSRSEYADFRDLAWSLLVVAEVTANKLGTSLLEADRDLAPALAI